MPFVNTTSAVTYKTGLALDVYRPASLTGRPCIVLIHGGGWQTGSRSDAGQVQAAQRFARRGFVVFVISYTLAPAGNRTSSYRQPPIDDVGDAIAWVRANASTYGGDGTKVAAFGRSAGGHLALMAAFTKTGNSKPDAVLTWSAPTRLEDFDFTPAVGSREELAWDYIGVADLNDAAMDTFSPYYQTLTAAPPVRMNHADDEGLSAYGVPVSNADDMHAALIAAGRDSTKVIDTVAVHDNFFNGIDNDVAWLQQKLNVTSGVYSLPVAAGADDGAVTLAGSTYGGSDGGYDISDTPTSMVVANRKTGFGGSIDYFRSNILLRFNTGLLPDNAVINSTNLYISTNSSAILNVNSRNLQIEWIPDFGTINSADFSATPSGTAKAATALSSLAVSTNYEWALLNPAANIPLNAYVGLRFHIDGGAPTGNNYVNFSTFEHATEPEAELAVFFTIPEFFTKAVTVSFV